MAAAASSSSAGGTQAAAAAPASKAEHTIRILVFTDNHCGYLEQDPVRGNDSFEAFEEALRYGRTSGVDFAINCGDIFHENRPSRYSNHRVLTALRTYCMGSRPIDFELLGDDARHFGAEGKFRRVNYMDPHFNIDMPVFCIHGNHDDPIYDRGDTALGAIHVLEAANLINYFGRQRVLDDIVVEPLLFRKGGTNLALYGLGNMRDTRLVAAFKAGKVKFLRPVDKGSWVNVLLLHQNRPANRGVKASIPDHFIPDMFDLVIWGHEHECRIKPEKVGRSTVEADGKDGAVRSPWMCQPGSSVATSLVAGEAVPKHVAILEVRKQRFRVCPHRLRSVRPFKLEQVVLARCPEVLAAMDAERSSSAAVDDEAVRASSSVAASVTRALQARVKSLLERANKETEAKPEGERPPESMRLPLVRLVIDHTGLPTLSSKLFGAEFVGQVANPDDMLQFVKVKAKAAADGEADRPNPLDDLAALEAAAPDGGRGTITALLRDTLKDSSSRMAALTDVRLVEALERFVWENDHRAFEVMLSKRLKSLQRSLGDRASDGTDLESLIRDDTAADHMAVMRHKRRAPSRAREQSEHALRALAADAGAAAAAGAAPEDSDSEEEPEAERAVAIERARKRGRAEAAAEAANSGDDIDSESESDGGAVPARPAPKLSAPKGVPADLSDSSSDEGGAADVHLSSRSVPRSRRTVGPSTGRRSASRSRSRAPESAGGRRRNRGARLE